MAEKILCHSSSPPTHEQFHNLPVVVIEEGTLFGIESGDVCHIVGISTPLLNFIVLIVLSFPFSS